MTAWLLYLFKNFYTSLEKITYLNELNSIYIFYIFYYIFMVGSQSEKVCKRGQRSCLIWRRSLKRWSSLCPLASLHESKPV